MRTPERTWFVTNTDQQCQARAPSATSPTAPFPVVETTVLAALHFLRAGPPFPCSAKKLIARKFAELGPKVATDRGRYTTHGSGLTSEGGMDHVAC